MMVQGIRIQNVIKKSSHLTTLACHVGRYRFTRLPFGVSQAGDVFQRKIDEISKGLPNIFGVADDILIVGYDADIRDHNISQRQVRQVC